MIRKHPPLRSGQVIAGGRGKLIPRMLILWFWAEFFREKMLTFSNRLENSVE